MPLAVMREAMQGQGRDRKGGMHGREYLVAGGLLGAVTGDGVVAGMGPARRIHVGHVPDRRLPPAAAPLPFPRTAYRVGSRPQW